MTNQELQYFIKRKNEGVTGNDLKNEIQDYIIKKWIRDFNGVGFVKAYTGFGKSHMARTIFQRFEAKFSNENKGVIVPNTTLLNDFKSIGSSLNIKNYFVHVINSYVLSSNPVVTDYGLFVVDELHRICSEMSEYFKLVIPKTTFKYFLGISASLSKEHEEFLNKFNLKCVFEITLEEGIRLGIASLYTILNIGVDLTKEEEEKFKNNEKLFDKTFSIFKKVPQYNSMSLAFACGQKSSALSKVERTYAGVKYVEERSTDEWVAIISSYLSLEPKELKNYAAIFRHTLLQRNKIVNKSSNKLKAVNEILENMNSDIYSISFLSSIEQIDDLESKLNNKALGYHSKLKTTVKRERLHAFKQGVFNHLLTAKSVDEGADFPRVSVGIDYHFYSKPVQTIQRLGRIMRIDSNNINKKPYFIFLYCNPFGEITNDVTEKMYFEPPDFKKLMNLQKELINVKQVNIQECLEIINEK